MADVISTAKGLFGGFSLGTLWTGLGILFLTIVVCAVGGFAVYWALTKKKFNKTITFWKYNPLTGKNYAVSNIKAMSMRFTPQGDMVFRLKKPFEGRNVIERLKYEARPNQYYVHYGEDGKLREFDGIIFSNELNKMTATYRDDNTELSRSSMLELSKERYEKPKFLEKYGSIIVNLGAIVIIMVFLYMITDKLIDILSSIGTLIDRSESLVTAQNNVLDSLNNLLKSHNIIG